ncbi:hypothetical protein J2793_006597 [Paraburkholderia caledonica]|uniref:Uncharacterized protein n=1 Tax=Paraburkholderia caledonica TaxID=134536 RepID=A0AB73ISZ0_9BURK|nr:hypothetical protein [Paraburkholderia caledonica]
MARGERAAVRRAAEQDTFGRVRRHRQRDRAGERMIFGDAPAEERIEFRELAGEIGFPRLVVKPLQHARGQRQSAGRLADDEIDAARRERGEQLERFRDLERAVVLQHHAARADANARRRLPARALAKPGAP